MSASHNQGIFKIGDVLNNTYRIEEVLGRGGTSEVYKARSEISGRVMALKALRQEFSRNDDFLALMTREEEMRDIRHDAIVRYYDNQRTETGLVYLVMDYVEGPGLEQKIDDGGMSAADLLIVARRVTEGLAAAHAKKIVHRDLSPDNIILRHGDPADAVIIDFGIAKDTNEGAQTIVGNEFAGKYAYAAPEQLSGQTDARADIYALGALLLATFRGDTPKIGSNPMEVVEKKGKPLDTDGVPEPLKTLIDRMTHPDREKRLQSAQAVLAHIDESAKTAPPAEVDPDKTVIAPLPELKPAKAEVSAPGLQSPPLSVPPHSAPPNPPDAPPPATKPEATDQRGGGGKLALIAVVFAALLGAGSYFGGFLDGLLGPSYPPADPYTLTAARPADGAPSVSGHMPSEEDRDEILALMEDLGGSADVTLASGELPDGWGADIAQVIGIISVLPEWQLQADGADVQITGQTGDATQRAQLTALLSNGGLPGGLAGTTEITYVPPILAISDVTQALNRHANCGSLELVNAPAVGFTVEDQVMVLGKVADIETRVALSDELTGIIGDRDLLLNVDVLNPTLCLVDAALPDLPEGGFDLTFRMGSDESVNPSGRYYVGENPVIDVTIPANVTSGYLLVSIIDVEGVVFALLPNQYIEGNSIEELRGGREGPVEVRLAFPITDPQSETELAFEVDDSILGKSQVVALHADSQIFGGVRPRKESAEGFVKALEEVTGTLRSLDSRILIIDKP